MKYSIRMRAAEGGSHEEGGRHISGAERILTEEEIKEVTNELIERALTHSKGRPDFIRITIDTIDEEAIQYIPALPSDTVHVDSMEEGRKEAVAFLTERGISQEAAQIGIRTLLDLDENMRGAVLLDARSGQRLDTKGMRGIRVTKMDFANPQEASNVLTNRGLPYIHHQEAVVLASKVLAAPGIVGELCWSDDPEYVAGYVSALKDGQGHYHRISQMKPLHSQNGGRVFFLDGSVPLAETIAYLEKQVVLVETPK